MPWWYAIAERDHVIQNPTSEEKIRALGEQLLLGPESLVLDLACGKAGPAVLLAQEFGCRIVGVERAAEFASVARERVDAAGLADRIEISEGDAATFPIDVGRYDVALCLGASFVWGGLAGTLAALAPGIRQGRHVAVGEPYWRALPLPDGVEDEGYVSLADTAGRFAAAGLDVQTVIASSLDDWDRYESLHWRAVEEWLVSNSDDPAAGDFRRRHETYRDGYLRHQRGLLGWAILVGRKP
jgi:SAM-dependent methyltransferase